MKCKSRKLTLCKYKGGDSPILTIAGKYLKEWGYDIGLRVEVLYEDDGSLRIKKLPIDEQPYLKKIQESS